MLVCVLLLPFARETAGAARTRSSLRPLYFEAQESLHSPGASRRGNAKVCPAVIATRWLAMTILKYVLSLFDI
jgi:hypothetical protein